jgi:hypothetical protein
MRGIKIFAGKAKDLSSQAYWRFLFELQFWEQVPAHSPAIFGQHQTDTQ